VTEQATASFALLGLVILFIIVKSWDAHHTCTFRHCPHKKK